MGKQKVQYPFPNKRFPLTKAAKEFLGINDQKAAKEWCQKWGVTIFPVGKGAHRNRYYVLLWALQEGMKREESQHGVVLTEPKIPTHAIVGEWDD